MTLPEADAERLATALTTIRRRGTEEFFDRLSRLTLRHDDGIILVTQRVGSTVLVTRLNVDDPGGAARLDEATSEGAQVTFVVDNRTQVVSASRVRPIVAARSTFGTSRATRSKPSADVATEKDAGATARHLIQKMKN